MIISCYLEVHKVFFDFCNGEILIDIGKGKIVHLLCFSYPSDL